MVRITLDKPYIPIPVPVTDGLELTFDDIENVPVADASSVSDWNTFFDLPTNGTPFTSVVVEGDKVTLIGGANIHLKNDLFYLGGYTYNETLLSVIDTNSVVSAGDKCFNYCNRLTRLEFPVMTTAGEYTFQLVDFDNPNECILVFPSLEEVGTYCFAECLSVTEFDFPQLTTSAAYSFAYNTSAVSFNFPLLSPLGGSSGDDGFFAYITFKTIALTVPASAMTCNGGNPDGDIEYLQSFNTVTITTV